MFKIFMLMNFLFLYGCSAKIPSDIGVVNGRLSDCPNTPNCVNSNADDETHKINGFRVIETNLAAWENIISIVEKSPRTKVITKTDGFMHAEISSAVWGFVDDLQLYFKKQNGLISLKSAARSGYSDFGVNRKRLESLRLKLIKEKIIEE